ncbi:MAG: molybdenum cofactor guanylyltransferase [Pseudomonadota bacterium]
MTLLGAVLAGGQSRRFGSDKAMAMLDGRALIDRVIAAIAPQVDAVIVCGRAGALADRPGGNLGPLAGINAALHHARATGFDAVVSVPCDSPFLPGDLVARIGVGPVSVVDSPVIGCWPTRLADDLDAWLATGPDRSMRGWIRACGARVVDVGEIVNVNTPAELRLASARLLR